MRKILDRSSSPAIVCGALILVSAIRVGSTWPVFSQTSDEPAHVAAGMELLDRGTYTYEAQHPPLARVASAVGPFLLGERSRGLPRMRDEGRAILLQNDNPHRTIAAARAGMLPFLVVLGLAVFFWSRSLYGDAGGLLALGIVTFLPIVLAHAGLATTDMACAAFITASIWAFARWLEAPSARRAALVGGACGLALTSKFSALLFLPVSFLVLAALRFTLYDRSRAQWSMLARIVTRDAMVCAIVGVAVIWVIYGFSIGRPQRLGGWVPVPAPEIVPGVLQVAAHNATGHPSYLLGRISRHGWWYFFPVAIAVKTPLPMLALIIIGLWTSVRLTIKNRDWRFAAPAAASLAMLVAVLPANINIGLRHVLPIFPPLTIAAGGAAICLWNAERLRVATRTLLIVLAMWFTAESVTVHPDYIAYFNELADAHPERVLVDSDLDWGQDFYRLVDEVERRGIDSIAVAYWASIDMAIQGTPGMSALPGFERPKGWIAVSDLYRSGLAGDSGYVWLQKEVPAARVGRTIWLYHLGSIE